ncbi:3-dehydroquinate synthase [Piscinibacterium candidicorallinum]|uniref:3-dehydroquinate synthase n=1 Tax=Piscinibacterium candidicorallinum TaxID=1793872 RepID=A0ABV7H4H1_9BURK
MSVDALTVALATRSYSLDVRPGVARSWPAATAVRQASARVVVTNRTIAALYPELVAGTQCNLRIELEDGERYKTADSVDVIHSALLRARCDRKCIIVAVGGGVVGDTAGFAAATYMRGIPFIQVPTTLLAQVDSSIGGKTAINHPLGKNMIGAFHQPSAVFIDPLLLNTLPDAELSAGFAEIIKHALIRDAAYLDWLEANSAGLLARDPELLTHAIRRSCEIKAAIVEADEFETGERALLNLGHTFGHALEAVLGFGTWLHGQAVGCGLVLATDMSARLGLIDSAAVARVQRIVSAFRLPVRVPAQASTSALVDAMLLDKKNEGGRVRFILLEAIGRGVIRPESVELAAQVIDAHR